MNSAIKQTQSELKGVTSLLKLDPKNTTLLAQKQKLLAEAVVDTKDKLTALQETQRKIDDGSIQATEEQYRDLEREIASTEQKLKKLTDEQRQYASVASVQMQQVGKEFSQVGEKMTAAGKALLPLTAAIGAVGAASLNASVQFESSFAGVKKTVNATVQELHALAEASREAALSKPVDVNDINHIMELGGQLGIATDSLSKFASVVGDLDVATDMNIEDASLQLAQFMNICGTSQSDIDRLGATIVDLGNNSATTESTITDFAMRIAGSGTQIGMTEAQILGLSASLASVGIQAEMGGSAISTIMSQIDKDVAHNGEDLAAWADAAGMSAQEFAQAWETDAAGALVSLIGGMQEASESGSNLNLILDDLGVTEIRKTDTLKRLTSAAGLMATTMDTATNAWQQNTALTNEAAQRYSTTESKLLMLKNQVNEAAISVGNGFKGALAASIDVLGPFLDAVISIAHGFENADPAVQSAVTSMLGLTASIAPLLIVGGKLTLLAGNIVTALAKASSALVAKAAATTADTVATEANAKAQTAQIAKQAVKDAMDARAAIRAASKAAATAADTVATTANTAATGANAAATGTATIKTVALSVAAKAKAAAAAIATVAQLAWNAAMAANPAGAVAVAVTALATAIGVAVVAISSAVGKQDQLTEASERQQAKVDELRASYDEAVDTQGEHSDAAVQAKYALDEETASLEASKETMEQFKDRCKETIDAHAELKDSISNATTEADSQAGKVLTLSERIADLSAQENKSAEDKAKLSTLTAQLNASCSDLKLTYDEQTDSLNMSADAMQKLASAEADRLRADAAMSNYSDLLEEQVTLEAQLAEAQENLDAETQRNVDSWGKLGDVQVYTSQTQTDLENTVSETQAALDENTEAQRRALEMSAKYATKQSILSKAIQEVEKGTLTAEQAAEKYSDAVEGGISADEIRAEQAHQAAIAEEELAKRLNEAEQAVQSYADTHASFKNALELSGLSVKDFSAILASQDVDFEEAAKAIEQYSSTAASGFSKISDSSSNTLDALYETLASNLSATENWSSNLKEVFGRAGVSFSQEFVNAVKSGGVSEYGTVMAQLAQLSDDELQNISDSFARNGQAGVEAYLNEQKLLVPGTKEALDGTSEAVDEALSGTEQAAGEAGSETGAAYSESLKEAIFSCPQEVRDYIAELEESLKSAEDAAATAGDETGSNYSDSLKAAIASCPQEVQAYIASLEAQLSAFQQQAGNIGSQTGAVYGQNTASSMADQGGAVAGSADFLRASAQSSFDLLMQGAQDAGSRAGSSFSGGIAGMFSAVFGSAMSLSSGAEAGMSAAQGAPYGANAGNQFASAIGSAYSNAYANAQTIAGACRQWSLISSQASMWGWDAGAGFARGISSAISLVQGAASSIASAIRSVLHFSVPDEGPLADADEYGPDFVQLIADGMTSRLDDVKEAARQVAQTTRTSLEGALADADIGLGISKSLKGGMSAATAAFQRNLRIGQVEDDLATPRGFIAATARLTEADAAAMKSAVAALSAAAKPSAQSEANRIENNTYYISGINVTGTSDGQFASEFMDLMKRYGRLAKT